MLFEITEKQILALKAVVYGCNTNRRLVGAAFASGIGSESEQTISFYDAIRIADNLLEQPAVDAVPVVCCADCKWYNNRMCYHPRFDYVCEVPPTMLDFDYCRYGERRDGDG